ncbi:hypothetical protein phytr_1110 [Candidatus Phycorickettsia trachydisci]|uniref:Uncharacterized protein n=1 Tax=Candidatus Phycorickettsia trachydisci TaxID=2115978 RepID=A0A2P1P725_9RICK|nr:hypothetical protein [Candidatus Phycorickettsia trachydisci]AVP87072.1 hypothetical protein phytr_1110 [Candidatus Phycorickettsia trachydisci]
MKDTQEKYSSAMHEAQTINQQQQNIGLVDINKTFLNPYVDEPNSPRSNQSKQICLDSPIPTKRELVCPPRPEKHPREESERPRPEKGKVLDFGPSDEWYEFVLEDNNHSNDSGDEQDTMSVSSDVSDITLDSGLCDTEINGINKDWESFAE